MPWKPLPSDVPLDDEQVQPPATDQPSPADQPADQSGNFEPLPADAQLDAPTDQQGFTDEQKQAILDYIPKAKDAADLERFSKDLSGGTSHVGNAQQVLDDYRKGHKQFSWAEPIVAKPDTPEQQPDDLRSQIGDGIIESLDTFFPGAGALLRKARDNGSGKAFTEHAANAVAMDYGPEVAGVLHTITSPSEWSDFKANLDRSIAHERATMTGDSEGHPVASAAGEVTGAGLATPLIGAAAEGLGAARLAGTAGPTARAFAQSAIEGATYGSGAAGPGNRGEGAAIGAAVAPVVAGTVAAVPAIYQAGKSVLSENPSLARRIIAKAIDADGNTPTSVAEHISAANENDVPMMIADTGENTRGLLAATARSSGGARTLARDALEERQAGLADRVTGSIERHLGPVADPHAVADALMTKARDEAAPLYRQAYAKPVSDAFMQKIEPLLQRPSMQKALNNAARIAQEEGENPDALGLMKGTQGQFFVQSAPSWKTLDYIKRGMDDVVEGYKDPVTGKYNFDTEGRAVNNTLRSFLKASDQENPAYGAARAAFGGPVSGISAMNAGRKALNMTADDLEARMRDMTPFQKQMFALGTRRAMAELVASKGDTADVVHALVGTGKKRAMLARLFGDRKTFGQFVDTLGQEREGFRTFKQALLGSPTAPNLQDDATLQLAIHAADAALTGLSPIAALRSALKFGVGKIGDKAKQQVAALLSNTDPARFRELSDELRAEALRRGLFNHKVGVIAGSAGNAAATAVPQPR